MNKQKSIKPHAAGCLCCPQPEQTLLLETVLYQGFGGWHIEKDGKLFFMDNCNKEWEEFKTLEFFERKAKREPSADWRAVLFNPLHGETYQRQRGKWILIKQNEGFA